MTGTRLYKAVDSGWAHIGEEDVLIQAGQIAHGDHPVMRSHGHMFEPLDVTYDVDEPEPKAPARTPSAAAKKQGAGQ